LAGALSKQGSGENHPAESCPAPPGISTMQLNSGIFFSENWNGSADGYPAR